MFKFKRIAAIVCCTALAVSAFSGCTAEKTSTGDVSEITIWSQNAHSKTVYEKLIGRFNETTGKEKGIKINYLVKEGDTMSQNVELALQNGTLPEMFSSGAVASLAEKGAIMALEDIPGGDKLIEKYKDSIVEKVNSYKGKTYSIPTSATTQALVYNKQMFIDAGIVDENGNPTPPETFEELREYAKKLTNAKKKQYGIVIPLKWSGLFANDITDSLMASAGNTGFDPVTGEFDYTKLAPIMQCYVDMKNDGSIFPGADGMDNDQARAYFSNGNIGMKFAYSYDVGVYNDQFPAKIEWGVAPVPVIDKNEVYKQRLRCGHSFYVSSTATEKIPAEKIMEVLLFFDSNEFVTELYKSGVSAPFDWSVVEDVELENPKKGWKEFCELVKISAIPPQLPETDMTGQVALKDRFLNEIWTGKAKAEEVVKEYNPIINTAMERYYETHPDEDKTTFINGNWNAER